MKTTKGKTTSVKLRGLGMAPEQLRKKEKTENEHIYDDLKALRNRSSQSEFQNKNLDSN
jgi:hypothetical protein